MPGNRLQFLTANDWVLIQARVKRHTFKLGEEIIRQGASGGSLHIIRRGEASVELGQQRFPGHRCHSWAR